MVGCGCWCGILHALVEKKTHDGGRSVMRKSLARFQSKGEVDNSGVNKTMAD